MYHDMYNINIIYNTNTYYVFIMAFDVLFQSVLDERNNRH